MNIVYVSSLCSKEKFNDLNASSREPLSQAAQKYHRLLTQGFSKNKKVKVNTITAMPITTRSSNKIYIKASKEERDGVIYNYLFIINIPLIKNLLVAINSFIKTSIFCMKDKNTVIICDILNISVSIGALLAAKLFNKKNVGIVTDVPNFLASNNRKLSVKINNKLMNSFNSYVFLTEAMKDVIDCENKKYVVIEGLVDCNMKDVENTLENKYKKKVCIYAGGIQKIYGIKYLTEAFIQANVPNTELHIYGSGDFEEELIDICKLNNNIKYFGVKPNDYVVKEELKATLLINPRPTNEEYTKYSFPSKNMEYMVSGTPVLTTNLPGMPKSYEEYVYIIENESVEGLKNTLQEILSKSSTDLYNKGYEAKKFVINQKNNIKQSEKIIKMIE